MKIINSDKEYKVISQSKEFYLKPKVNSVYKEVMNLFYSVSPDVAGCYLEGENVEAVVYSREYQYRYKPKVLAELALVEEYLGIRPKIKKRSKSK